MGGASAPPKFAYLHGDYPRKVWRRSAAEETVNWSTMLDAKYAEHHAVVTCTKAKVLRQEVRGSWPLPDESQFQNNGPDWLLVLLSNVDRTTRTRILLLFWRAWYLRNDVIHGRGTGSVVGSANFIVSYAESLQVGGRRMCPDPDMKGKGKLVEARSAGAERHEKNKEGRAEGEGIGGTRAWMDQGEYGCWVLCTDWGSECRYSDLR
jgi:hypothetical protein